MVTVTSNSDIQAVKRILKVLFSCYHNYSAVWFPRAGVCFPKQLYATAYESMLLKAHKLITFQALFI